MNEDAMSDCPRFHALIESRLTGPLSEASSAELAEHCRTCAECAALAAADAELTALAVELEPSEGELLEVRRGVLRQARRDAVELRPTVWSTPWRRAALTAQAWASP
jgi:predicted anti-sigma-YlaC factor YlaD